MMKRIAHSLTPLTAAALVLSLTGGLINAPAVFAATDFDQLRRENLDKDAVNFDQLRRENLDKDATDYNEQRRIIDKQ
ncbi:MAG: hypothetical protein ACFBSG_09650 [Leptolyngbyaceae cyanobacterium]